ncbi:NAC transcription factor NAM-B1 [Brachypodium distachyon]|uniref:NAC transcription factor NAM-B1 n=1 Tax=Brachypodium distachyon TaxID=15368 RepID=UPI00052FE7C2|nr:NAC transcription factor NAM-B1 [Brachypodium distachyon]|eukprot:XP_010229803.1 NAC transcription factor NAM-B1 [Brachypodium distachyon]
MEAARLGFNQPGLSPEFKFDPTDDDLVAHYLLPRALGLPGPHEHAVIEADPGGLPPWEVLEAHGIDMFSGADNQAFFFGPVPDAGRMVRRVKGGGYWQGQGSQGDDGVVVFLRGDGSEVDVRFKMYNLTFYESKEAEKSSGFVMHEFVIVDPPLPGTVLTRIRFDKAKERRAAKLAKESVRAGKQPVADGGGDALFNGGVYYGAPLGVVFPGSGDFSGGGCYFPDLDTQLDQSTSYSQAECDEYYQYQQQQYQQFIRFQMEQQCWQAGDPRLWASSLVKT